MIEFICDIYLTWFTIHHSVGVLLFGGGGTCTVMYRSGPEIPRQKTSTQQPHSLIYLVASACQSLYSGRHGALIKWDRYSDSCICGSQCAALAVMLRPGTPRHRQTATNACGHAGSVSRSKHVFLSQQSQ